METALILVAAAVVVVCGASIYMWRTIVLMQRQMDGLLKELEARFGRGWDKRFRMCQQLFAKRMFGR